MKKKILIFFDTLDIPPKTGTSYRFFYQSMWLHSYGYDIVVILCDRNGDAEKVIESLPYEFHILSPDKFYDVELISQISEEISPDIVQVITPQNVLKIGYPVSKKLQIPLIVEMHDIERDLFSKLKKPESELDEIEFTQYAAAQIADGIIVLTEYDKQRLLDYGIPESKIIVSPIGIDFRYFHYQLPANTNEIVFLGNLYYEPNKRAVLRILKNILNQTENIKKFNIIGMAPDKLIEEFNRYEKVQYHGAVDDYRSIIHKSTLAVAPIFEGSGIKVKMLSFASLGIPIISTDIGLVGYPKDFAFENNNLELYGEQITELLKDRNKIESQSRQARELVEKYFNWDSITEDLIEFYQDIKYSSKDYKEIGVDIVNSDHLEYDLPLPVWLQEKRVKNKNYSKHIKRAAVKFEPYSEANLPTRYGQFKIRVYRNSQSQEEHFVIYKGDISNPNINMRIHSSCVTGDILGSYKCDCGDQLNKSLELFSKTDGLIIYLFQEGRGIGLGNKIKAYKLQDEGYDTYEANVMLGLSPDNREYNMIRDICEDLKINSVTLFTNNPEKLDIFRKLGIRAKRGFLPIDINKVNKKYLETKRDKFDHLLDI